jgi:hypothetical protein
MYFIGYPPPFELKFSEQLVLENNSLHDWTIGLRDWAFVDKAAVGTDRSPQRVVGIEGDVGTADKGPHL